MIRATPADQPAIAEFLMAHVTTSMFPLSNLRRYGMDGDHKHSLRIWLRWQEGQITDVLAQSRQGMVFPQCPTGPWGDVRVCLAGRGIIGVLGDADQVTALRAAVGLQPASGFDVTEPHYDLPLRDLRVPDCSGCALRPIDTQTRPLAEAWRAAYITEVLDMPGEDPAEKARADIAGYIAADSHRFLFWGDTAVAFTGFNATMPEVVQIGGVYTPPERRSQGMARRAVALHLREAQQRGVTKAILSAASDSAARAYQAIGFRRAGDFAFLMFSQPQVTHV